MYLYNIENGIFPSGVVEMMRVLSLLCQDDFRARPNVRKVKVASSSIDKAAVKFLRFVASSCHV